MVATGVAQGYPGPFMRFGTVALLGRTNVGKSTFLNAALGTDLAIVSNLPQTTRDALLGVLTEPAFQIAFLDTPGLHRPKSELGRRMNQSAIESMHGADAILMVTDVDALTRGSVNKLSIDTEDRALIARLSQLTKTPALLVINKVDLVSDKSRLLPLIAEMSGLYPFRSILPLSLLQAGAADRVVEALLPELPEREAVYPKEMLTDKPERYFAREYIREQVLHVARREVPHAVAVSIDRYEDGPITGIGATIHVEKPGQRKILVGRGGSSIRDIGTQARLRIEALIGKRVHLSLFVRVTPRWKNAARRLTELGYSAKEPATDRGPDWETDR